MTTNADIHEKHLTLNKKVVQLWADLFCGVPDKRTHEEWLKVSAEYVSALTELVSFREKHCE